MQDYREKIIIALDLESLEDVKLLIDRLGDDLKFVKVGMQLYYLAGNEVIKYLNDKGLKVFLDLKLHDIPNTVGNAVSSLLTNCKIDILNVHSLGGKAMMESAVNAVDAIESDRRPKLIAVTQLTSTSQKMICLEQKVDIKLESHVNHLALLAKESGLNGVVCSALEVKQVKSLCGDDFITVTPGIRLDKKNAHDQVRIMAPKEAFNNGADFIVVGREVVKSENPRESFLNIVNSIL